MSRHRASKTPCAATARVWMEGVFQTRPSNQTRIALSNWFFATSRRVNGRDNSLREGGRSSFASERLSAMVWTLWQNATPAKKPWSRFRRLQNLSRSMARTCWNRPISSASYARPRNVSPKNQESQRASKRSIRPEKFVSRFFASFTFFSVSVTRTAFLPSDFRPAPLRFPPCCFLTT